MKKRTLARIVILLCIAALIVPAASCKSKSAFEKKYGPYTPELWYVENASGNRVYLFGSIHIGVKEMYPMPDEVWSAFTSSANLCVETDITAISPEDSAKMISFLSYSDGTVLRDHVDTEVLEQLVEAGGVLGIPLNTDMVGGLQYTPMMMIFVFDDYVLWKTDFSSNYGVDTNMIMYAKENGITVKDIEDPFTTYERLGKLSTETQTFLLSENLSYITDPESDFKAEYDGLFSAWANGIMGLYYSGSEEYETEESRFHNELYNEILLYERNILMADKVEEYLATGESHFYVVGALHYQGDKGIIRLLEQRGLTVHKVKY